MTDEKVIKFELAQVPYDLVKVIFGFLSLLDLTSLSLTNKANQALVLKFLFEQYPKLRSLPEKMLPYETDVTNATDHHAMYFKTRQFNALLNYNRTTFTLDKNDIQLRKPDDVKEAYVSRKELIIVFNIADESDTTAKKAKAPKTAGNIYKKHPLTIMLENRNSTNVIARFTPLLAGQYGFFDKMKLTQTQMNGLYQISYYLGYEKKKPHMLDALEIMALRKEFKFDGVRTILGALLVTFLNTAKTTIAQAKKRQDIANIQLTKEQAIIKFPDAHYAMDVDKVLSREGFSSVTFHFINETKFDTNYTAELHMNLQEFVRLAMQLCFLNLQEMQDIAETANITLPGIPSKEITKSAHIVHSIFPQPKEKQTETKADNCLVM